MKRGRTIGTLIAVVLLLGTQAFGGIVKFPICQDPGWQRCPKVSGNIVVWEDLKDVNNGNWDIYGKDLSTGVEFPICTAIYDQSSPSVSGNIVVWADPRQGAEDCTKKIIYGYNLSTKTEFSIPWEQGYKQEKPVVSGDWIVYCEGGVRVSGYNLSTRDKVIIAENQLFPDFDIDNSRVVWSSYTAPLDIMGYDLAKGESFSVCLDVAEQRNPVISGNFVAWMDYRDGNWDIYGKDLSIGKEFPICTEAQDQYLGDISGDIVVWEDSRGRIYGYDLITGVETFYTAGFTPAIDGDLLIFGKYASSFNDDIYGAYIPEPASLTILFTGAGLLILRRRLEKVC